MQELIIAVKDIREGDVFTSDNGAGWTALADAETTPDGRVHLAVVYKDGGRSVRQWAATDAHWQLAIVRDGEDVG